jgi:small ligand-binding sensory domain FIST
MRWVSSISDQARLDVALTEVCVGVQRSLAGDAADLLLIFVSRHHLFDFGTVVGHLRENFGPDVPLAGCSAAAVLGDRGELEDRPGVALVGAHLPAVEVRVLHLENDELPPLDGSPQPWRQRVNIDPQLRPAFVVLGEPFTCDAPHLLQGLDYAYPGSSVVGGMASGASGPGSNALFTPVGIQPTGGLVVGLYGNITVDTIVAQGCKPIGSPARVSACDGNLLKELDGRSPREVLKELFESLGDDDRERARSALHLGVVMDEMRSEIGHGDFLIRNILGMDPQSGILAVGTPLRPGQTVQFHLRDRSTADNDLRALLDRYVRSSSDSGPAGALLFSCLGRGRSLYGEPDHDSRCFLERLGRVPLGGFFCNGEIGPVAGSTYLHGYTSAFGIFRPRSG